MFALDFSSITEIIITTKTICAYNSNNNDSHLLSNTCILIICLVFHELNDDELQYGGIICYHIKTVMHTMQIIFEVPTYSSPDHSTTTAEPIHLDDMTLGKTSTSLPEHYALTVRIT